MNVLYLNNYNYLRGGSERVMFEEMRLLRQAGQETGIFSRTHENNVPSKFQALFPPAINTERMSISLQSLKAVKELVYSYKSRDGIAEVIRSAKPDIIHAHNIYGRLSTSTLDEPKIRGIPVVMTLHDLKLLCPSYLMLNHGQVCERCKGGRYHQAVLSRCLKNSYLASAVYAFESWFSNMLNKYDSVCRFISPSHFLRSKCIEYGWPADKIAHIPNFIDTKTLTTSPAPGNYFLYIGRLSHEKGVKTLLQALSQLKAGSQLLIVGDGPERTSLESYAFEQNLNVRFTGYLSGLRLQESIANAKAMIMPSECYENAPLSILEAFAYGKPVIGARIGGIPEMIDDGVNGYLFEPNNSADLHSKLELLLGLSSGKLADMGKAAREKVDREYSAEGHFNKLMAVYSAAMEGKPCT